MSPGIELQSFAQPYMKLFFTLSVPGFGKQRLYDMSQKMDRVCYAQRHEKQYNTRDIEHARDKKWPSLENAEL